MDKYSSRYLNITLIGGSGSIIGTIKVCSCNFKKKLRQISSRYLVLHRGYCKL